MSGNLLTYSGIITKVRALQSQLMTQKNYEEIASLETTADFINYLKKQPGFSGLFSHYDENSLHRSQIEQLLPNSLYLTFARIYGFSNASQRTSLEFLFFRYETNLIKSYLQNLYNDKTTDEVLQFETFFNKHSDFPIGNLVKPHSIEEFIQSLNGSEYFSLFQKWEKTNQDDLRKYNVQLDLHYFTKVWSQKNHTLKGTNLKVFTDIIGSKIDLLNIEWAYRSKFIYNMEPPRVLASMIPVRYKLTKDQLHQMVHAVSYSEFEKCISHTYYSNVFNAIDLSQITIEYRRILKRIYRKNAAKYPSSMAPVFYYLFLKEEELDRLTTALECIRYHLGPQESLKYILD